jgi:xanthine dehydrogenase YagS FAD-binding subunit
VLGTSNNCIATYPSDMAIALVALDALVHTRTLTGARTLPAAELHVEPGDHPERETVLARGELITHVELPATTSGLAQRYIKVRDRAAFAFALASAAVVVELAGGTIRSARIALGGVATRPWRARAAEQELAGQRPGLALFSNAARTALADAKPQEGNRFKVELAQRVIVRALTEATELRA